MIEMLWMLLLALAPPAAATVRACDVRAYVFDDRLPLAIRAAPAKDAPVLGRLSDAFGVAHVRAQQGGWFRVASIVSDENGATMFAGDGWVEAGALGTDATGGAGRLYAGPDAHSGIAAVTHHVGEGAALTACAGPWARARFRDAEGWLPPQSQCTSALTTCP